MLKEHTPGPAQTDGREDQNTLITTAEPDAGLCFLLFHELLLLDRKSVV